MPKDHTTLDCPHCKDPTTCDCTHCKESGPYSRHIKIDNGLRITIQYVTSGNDMDVCRKAVQLDSEVIPMIRKTIRENMEKSLDTQPSIK